MCCTMSFWYIHWKLWHLFLCKSWVLYPYSAYVEYAGKPRGSWLHFQIKLDRRLHSYLTINGRLQPLFRSLLCILLAYIHQMLAVHTASVEECILYPRGICVINVWGSKVVYRHLNKHTSLRFPPHTAQLFASLPAWQLYIELSMGKHKSL